VKGLHDDELTWPLKGKFEVKLLNQISDCEHYSNIIDYADAEDDYVSRVTDGDPGKVWGCPEFITSENLIDDTLTCQYVKNNCIFFQVRKL